jgi:uncharacterized protein YhbP (UPF0306 family)
MKALEKLVLDILNEGYLMSLATLDNSGPWVSDVVYVNHEFDLYWRSSPKTRHSVAIETEKRVSCSITLSNEQGTKNKGVQIAGLAQLAEPENEITRNYNRKRNHPLDEPLPPGHEWYKLTPKFIDIIEEEKFGYQKPKIEF